MAALLATVAHGSADLEEFTFPDRPDGEALLRLLLATVAFVFSNVRYWIGVSWDCSLFCSRRVRFHLRNASTLWAPYTDDGALRCVLVCRAACEVATLFRAVLLYWRSDSHALRG